VQVSDTCVRMANKYKRTVESRSYMAYSAEKIEEALSAVRSHTLKNKLKGAHSGVAGGPTVF